MEQARHIVEPVQTAELTSSSLSCKVGFLNGHAEMHASGIYGIFQRMEPVVRQVRPVGGSHAICTRASCFSANSSFVNAALVPMLPLGSSL